MTRRRRPKPVVWRCSSSVVRRVERRNVAALRDNLPWHGARRVALAEPPQGLVAGGRAGVLAGRCRGLDARSCGEAAREGEGGKIDFRIEQRAERTDEVE